MIDNITHRADRIQWDIANLFYIYYIYIDEAVLHVTIQGEFLSWDLQNFIYLMSLINIS